MERTCVFLKPDGVKRKLIGRIMERFEERGLRIIGLKMMQFNEQLVREHYAHLVDKPFFKDLQKFIMSSPVVIMVLEGEDAVNVVLGMCGPTDPKKALSGTIRGDFAISVQENIIHRSDSKEVAKQEMARFFKESELFHY